MADLTGTTVAILASEGVEQAELTGPWDALKEAGATVHLISDGDRVQGFNHLDKADEFPTDRTVDQADPADYAALVLPGGVANPDHLRTVPEAVAFTRAFVDAGKPVAAICHAPWLLVEAGAVSGRRVASWPSLQTDLGNAGATWVDEQVVVDREGPGPLITSRNPDDIPAFAKTLVAELADPGSA
jgi:protease I